LISRERDDAVIGRAVAHRQRGLGRDQHGIAAAFDRFAKHLFGSAVRIDVGGVEQIDAGFEADVDQPPRFPASLVAPGAEQRAGAAKGSRAE
jgi:hypothetical protein